MEMQSVLGFLHESFSLDRGNGSVSISMITPNKICGQVFGDIDVFAHCEITHKELYSSVES